eukprot:1192832-Prorocentrum_minimum.AAC.2
MSVSSPCPSAPHIARERSNTQLEYRRQSGQHVSQSTKRRRTSRLRACVQTLRHGVTNKGLRSLTGKDTIRQSLSQTPKAR